MTVPLIVTKVVASLLLLPTNLILVCVAGMLLRRRCPSLGIAVSLSSLTLLVMLSTKAGALLLAAPLEQRTPPLVGTVVGDAQAIVILGGGGWRVCLNMRAPISQITGLWHVCDTAPDRLADTGIGRYA